MVVEQAEDEIAAINMVCGAAYAGVPAMTGTSGGGFALMVEGVALAGMLELPVTVFVGMRPGPATGLPTRTAQQDLLFVLYAGHGEFPRAIYAPGTVRQCFELTRRAIQTAQKYQTPTFILADQFLADAAKNIPPLDELGPAGGPMHRRNAAGRTTSATPSPRAASRRGRSPAGTPWSWSTATSTRPTAISPRTWPPASPSRTSA